MPYKLKKGACENPTRSRIRDHVRILFALFFCLTALFSPLFRCFAKEAPAPPSIVFLGDSTTNSLRYHGVLPGGKNTTMVWTGYNNTLSMWDLAKKAIRVTPPMLSAINASKSPKIALHFQSEKKNGDKYLDIATMATVVRPQYMIITLGINGCKLMSNADFTAEYKRLLDTLITSSPNTVYILQTIFPVLENARISNEEIDHANVLIHRIANEYNIPFLNTNPLLKEDNHTPNPRYIDPEDGIHWNKDGCLKILEVIKLELEQLAKTPTPIPY